MNFSINLPDYIPKWLAIFLVVFLVVCVAGVGFWKMVSDESQEYVGVRKVDQPSVIPYSPYSHNPTDTIHTKRLPQDPAKISGD